MKARLHLSCLQNDGALARAGTCRFRVASWLVKDGEHAEATHEWHGEPLVITLEADIVAIYGEVLEYPKKPTKPPPKGAPKTTTPTFWRADTPLIVYPGAMRLIEAFERPPHFAPVLGILSDSEDTVWYGIRYIVSRCRIVTDEVLKRITHAPLQTTVEFPLLPDGFGAAGARITPISRAAVTIDVPRRASAVKLDVSDATEKEGYPDLCRVAEVPMVTERIMAAGGGLERESVAVDDFSAFAAQVTFMGEPAMVGAAFPKGLLDGYPTEKEAAAGVLEPLHVHLAWNALGFWKGFDPYPAASTPPERWSFDSVYHNLYLLMTYLSHPERKGVSNVFPRGGNRFDPILYHLTVRAGRGFAQQLAAAKKKCALIVPVLGGSPTVNADELLDMDNLELLVAELQGAFYRARDHHSPVRPLGNISISTFSGGARAASTFLGWALGKEGAPKASAALTEKLREVYLFDPPGLGDAGEASVATLKLATEWREADPRRVVRLYTQNEFRPDVIERLLGRKPPEGSGVAHSDDGNVTVALVSQSVWEQTREAAIPARYSRQVVTEHLDRLAEPEDAEEVPMFEGIEEIEGLEGLEGVGEYPKTRSHGDIRDYYQWHQLFPDYFLYDALRRSRFTEPA